MQEIKEYEFKFKVFDKRLKAIFPVIYLHESFYGDCEEPNCYYLNDRNELEWLPMSEGILLRPTGLKDKNGVEIHQDDIVIVYGNKFIIKYEIGSFMLVRCSDSVDMHEMFKNCWNDDVYPLSQLYWEADYEEEDYIDILEVIGNVHGSELVKGE